MANASTKAIAKVTPAKTKSYVSSTKAYLEAIGGTSNTFNANDKVWVFGAGEWGSTKQDIQYDFDTYYKNKIDDAIYNGVTTFNVGTASGIDTLVAN